jgi:SNF2 family DNA or RNA helicase
VSIAARKLDARHRICMTGTPMENNLGDLWSLMSFANPGLLGTPKQFTTWYRTPIERQGATERFDALLGRVAPFMLRRTKAAVLAELPPKTEVVLEAVLEGPQRDLYESVRLTMEKRVREELAVRGLARSQIVVLDALLKLRQVCCHPPLTKLERARELVHGAKLELLLELVAELVAEGRRALVFSQFTAMLSVIERELDARSIRWLSITGATRQRQAIVDRFQAGEVPILLVSLKAGGTGLNLTAADTVIHYDPWWNPAVEAQATDRAHRIGQAQPVTVYRLICEGTVEERMLALQAKKAALLRGLQGGAEQRSRDGFALERADVDALLAPIDGSDAATEPEPRRTRRGR